MATFAKTTFNAAKYAISRPTYPRELYDSILTYHEHSLGLSGATARWSHALDLGCGTGQATAEILNPNFEYDSDSGSGSDLESGSGLDSGSGVESGSKSSGSGLGSDPDSGLESGSDSEYYSEAEGDGTLGFSRVTGVDPSAQMIEQATAYAESLDASDVLKFVQGSADNLKFINDKSVDMVISAQAAHWFEWDRTWPELSRVLRYGGTAAFWVYSEFRLPQYPQLTPLITEYAQGKDPRTSLGPHWEPGRRILDNHLLDIVPPAKGWDDFTRVFFTGDHHPTLPKPHFDPILRKTMTWGGAGLHGYLRTFSALHRYHETFPEDLQHSDGDIATRFLRTLMETAQVPLGEEGENMTVEVEWPLALVIARKELDPNDPWRQRHVQVQAQIGELKTSYDAAAAEAAPSSTVEETTEKLDKWIGVQEKVLEMVDADLESLAVEAQNRAQWLADDEEEDPKYVQGREKYLANAESTRSTVAWHLTFKRSFDSALELALATEKELGREDVAAGMERWVALMTEKIQAKGGVLPELPPDIPEDVNEWEQFFRDHDLSEEQIAELTEEQIEGFDEAEALKGIVKIVKELAGTVSNEPISDLVQHMYVLATEEVTREAVIE
ncbi:hypothetical protein C8R44DRAFT_675592 [Mycena epipterygia]|nr:hypothetical protein C8R44DRAFT_675592 [Mycena epipterygia]